VLRPDIAGSFLVAELSRRQVSLRGIFASVAVAAVFAALALLVKQWQRPDDSGPTPVDVALDAQSADTGH